MKKGRLFKGIPALLIVSCLLAIVTGIFSVSAWNPNENLLATQSNWLLRPGGTGAAAAFTYEGHLSKIGHNTAQSAATYTAASVGSQYVTVKFTATVPNAAATASFVFRNKTTSTSPKAIVPWEGDNGLADGSKPFCVNIVSTGVQVRDYNSGGAVTSAAGTYADGLEHTLTVKTEDVETGVNVKVFIDEYPDASPALDVTVPRTALKGVGKFGMWLGDDGTSKATLLVKSVVISDTAPSSAVSSSSTVSSSSIVSSSSTVSSEGTSSVTSSQYTQPVVSDSENFVKSKSSWGLRYVDPGSADFVGGALTLKGNPGKPTGVTLKAFKVAEEDITVQFTANVAEAIGFVFRNKAGTTTGLESVPWEGGGKPLYVAITASRAELIDYSSGSKNSVATHTGTYANGAQHTMVIKTSDVATGVQVTVLMDGVQIFDNLIASTFSKGEGRFGVFAYGTNDTVSLKAVAVEGKTLSTGASASTSANASGTGSNVATGDYLNAPLLLFALLSVLLAVSAVWSMKKAGSQN